MSEPICTECKLPITQVPTAHSVCLLAQREDLRQRLAEQAATIAHVEQGYHRMARKVAERDATIAVWQQMASAWGQESPDALSQCLASAISALMECKEQIAEIREALTRYGRHTSKCAYWSSERTMALRVCDCGLGAALAERPSDNPEPQETRVEAPHTGEAR